MIIPMPAIEKYKEDNFCSIEIAANTYDNMKSSRLDEYIYNNFQTCRLVTSHDHNH